MENDVTFLHPPSVFDFRERPILWGPINDLVPSKSVFEMYPIGFVSMASTLEKEGFRTDITNVALKMLRSPDFDPKVYLRKLDSRIFAIDLHWLPHVHGAIELARLCKAVHPDTPILMGGLSASYYHEEILEEIPEVDFVLRGDSVETPLVKLVREFNGGRNYEEIPNLSYRTDSGPKVNRLKAVPAELDSFSLDYDYVLRSLLRTKSLDIMPFQEFIKKPMMTVLTRKGCNSNCPGCGGSRYSYSEVCNRRNVAFRSPKKVVEDLKNISDYKTPAFVIGDLSHPEPNYGREIFRLLRDEDLGIPVVFEFFNPPKEDFLNELGSSVENFSIEMSPESGVEEVRQGAGREYGNEELRNAIKWSFESGCKQFDLYFMIGLSGQSRKTLSDTMEFIDDLLGKNEDGNLIPFISPYSPFLDPGSLAFEFPEKYGFTRYAESLMDHYKLLDEGLTWKDFLSYRTDELSREELVDVTYDFAVELAGIKERHGIITPDKLEELKEKIHLSKRMIRLADAKEDGLLDDGSVEASLVELKERLLIDRDELDWSDGITAERVFAVTRKVLKSFFTRESG
ncbi:MAG: TIGR04190 family B12-binding domain/radical SAM domain protein [Candidatus Acetothermia bacterium]